MTSERFSTCYLFEGMKSLRLSMNNFFKGLPSSQENKILEHTQMSLLIRRSKKGNLACCFDSFLQVFERGFLQKITHFDEKEGPIKAR